MVVFFLHIPKHFDEEEIGYCRKILSDESTRIEQDNFILNHLYVRYMQNLSIPKLKVLLVTSVLFATIPFLQAHAVGEEECFSCHEVRHGDVQCLNCHWNASTVSGKHPNKPYVPASVHGGFDWEADDSNETNLPSDQESCPACHVNLREHTSQIINTCEDCHVRGEYSVASTINLRSDITNLTPRIYSHYSNSTINVPPQSDVSSCFGFNASTGEGSCHGVDFSQKKQSGGYFAFNLNFTGETIRSDIYHWTASIDHLPQSSDCIFCHRQEKTEVRKAWGNPKPLPSDSSHMGTKNEDCRGCHVEGELKSVHGKEIVRVLDKSSTANILIISLIIIIFIIIFLWIKTKKS